jgi:polyphosphate kinase 2 (PPK2 family)
MMRKIRELNKKLKKNSNAAFKSFTDVSTSERRSGLKDRRKLPTFIMNDRRSGISDRRRKRK